MDSKLGQIDPSLEKQFDGHLGAITGLSYSPEDQQIASSSLDNSILVLYTVLSWLLNYFVSVTIATEFILYYSYGIWQGICGVTDSVDTMKL